MHCPACHAPAPDNARYCLQCGTPLRDGAAAPPTDPERAALERALGPQYEIGRLLGRGGMGAVYLARETALERAVAIKVLPPQLAADVDSRERFRREARTAAGLTHPNIVPLHTFGDAEGMPYFVMGYVHGESLGERMRREGRLPADDVRRIVGELAGALDYAHRQGVIHRDIKPDNVLLDDESGRPMLTDFGVAKARTSGATLTEAGAVVGTPHYMSPEQASGDRDLDGRSDLYSLGVMGYAMLSGRLPFEGDSFRDVIVQHVTKTPAPLRTLLPDVAPDLEAAIARCLAKDPSARWKDGGSLKEALGLFIGDDDDWLPGELREVSAGLFWSGAGALIPGIAAWLNSASLGGGRPVLTAVAALVVPISFLVTALVHHGKGYSWRQMARVAKWPPKWWAFAWPRSWRRPGDVWDRLPRAVVLQRHFYGAMACVASFVLPLWLLSSPSRRGSLTPLLAGWWVFLALGMMVTAWWAQRTGFPNSADLRSLILGSTTHKRFWRMPHVARLLGPAPSRMATPDRQPQAPAEFVLAMRNHTEKLSGPAHELGAAALDAARHVESALSQLDAEIAMLARDASAAEIGALEQKLAALGDDAGENPSRRELRQMLTNQRDLLKRLADQLAVTMRRRERIVDLLRTLWLQVANLRADAARDALADADVSGRIRSIVAEIGAYSEAAATVMLDTPTSGA
jgi:predicted Ser/Thr protein kinase